jgi:hypothetical protein
MLIMAGGHEGKPLDYDRVRALDEGRLRPGDEITQARAGKPAGAFISPALSAAPLPEPGAGTTIAAASRPTDKPAVELPSAAIQAIPANRLKHSDTERRSPL